MSRRFPTLIRRPGARDVARFGGGAVAALPTFTGQVVEDITTADRYRTSTTLSDHRPYPGADPAVWYLVMISRGENASVNTSIFQYANTPAGAGGWGWCYRGSGDSIALFCAGVNTNVGPLLDPEDGEVVIFHVTMDASGDFRGYRNGVAWDAPAASGTYSHSAFRLKCGNSGTVTGGIASVGYSFDAFLDAAGVEAHYQALLINHAATFTGQEFHFVADDADATDWVDRIGAISLVREGTPTRTAVAAAPFRQRYDPSWTSDTTAHPSGAVVDPHWLADGDSITVGIDATSPGVDGYVGVATARFASDPESDLQDWTTFNGANSGSTVADHESGGTDDITAHITAESPDVVSILLGTNDSGSAAALAAAKLAYARLITDVIAAGVARLVLCTVPSQSGAYGAMQMIEFNRWLLYEYWPTVTGITIHRCNLAPPSGPAHSGSDFADSVHPNDAGHDAISDQIYPVLRAAAGYAP